MRLLATRLCQGVPAFVFLLIWFVNSAPVTANAQTEPGFVAPRIVEPLDESRLTVLKGNTHRMARPQFDKGAAPADLPMDRMLLVLKRSPEQEAALAKLLDDQQDKDSPNYHKWLTPDQFGKQFGPADADMHTVTAWLESHGFRIGSVAKGRNVIEFSGTAAQVQEALHTSIHKYVVNGEEHWANSSDPRIPTALTAVVAGVHTLHNFLKKPMIHFSGEKVEGKYVQGKPQLTFSDGRHGLGPADYATIYNINPLLANGISGSGITVGVVARSNLYQGGADISQFRNVFGCCGSLNVVLNGSDPGDLGGGEEFEATLDATWPDAVAPGAYVQFVVSASTNTTDGVDLSELYIVDNNLTDIMTESFGSCEAVNGAQETAISSLAEQAAAQGITYMVSTGDSGAEGCDNPNAETVATGPVSVNILASTAYNVAVGGTIFNENGQTKYWTTNNGNGGESAVSYIPENVWNESCLASQCGTSAGIWSGGGGASSLVAKPVWQAGVAGIPNDGHRDLPDVSLTAAGHDPYLICFEGSCVPDSNGQFFLYFVSGTSASAPSFAGIMALVDEKMSSSGFSQRQGQANYVLYKLAATEKLSQCNASSTSTPPAGTCIFNDVTVGNNAVPGEVNYGKSNAQYQSTVGYDLATGLGSVNVTNLVNQWATATFKPSVATLTLNSTTFTHGQLANVGITVAPKSGTGTPTGDVSLIAATGGLSPGGVPMSAYTLTAGALNTTTNALPGGTYNVNAHYAGDGTFAPSDSTAFGPITVSQEPSITTAVALGYPDQNGHFPTFTSGPYGTFVYLRADVKGQSGFGIPTGTVNFSDNVPGNPYPLNSEGNTAPPNGLFNIPAAAHSVVAAYIGDNSFNPSSSAPVNFTITPAATTTTASILGTALTANIATKSGGDGPAGTVSFIVDGAQVGNPVPVTSNAGVINVQGDIVATPASATASITVTQAPKSSFKAVYSGDTNYVTSTSSTTADFTLTPGIAQLNIPSQGASGTITLTLTAINGFVGSIPFSASSCSGLPSETTCSFSPATLSGSGTTTLTIKTTAPAAAMLQRENRQRLAWWAGTGGFSLAGILLLNVPSKRRRAGILSLIVVGLLTFSACGGGGSGNSKPPSDPGTPFGKYTVVVSATSGALQHTASFTLNVQ